MKNRLIAYGFEQDAPQQPKPPKAPANQPRARRGKGKRLICRITETTHGSTEYKICIYVDGNGQYYVKGEKETPQEALRYCFAREFWCDDYSQIKREFVDRAEMRRLLCLVLPPPRTTKVDDKDDDNDGDAWKTAAE
jgi:hypothetical protein